MKFGMRKPSIKKSLKARTTGKYKRKVKKNLIPFYGKKGSGWVKNPKKALYNKVYNKTTFSVRDLAKGNNSSKVLLTPLNNNDNIKEEKQMKNGKKSKKGAIIGGAIGIFIVMLGISGARNSSKNSSDYENTTVVERIVIDSDETTEAVFSETTEEITTEKTTAATTAKPTTTVKPTTTLKPTTTERKTTSPSTTESEQTYILNNNTMKFHDPACRGVKQMKEENKQEYTGTREEVIEMGYSPCGTCKP